MNNHPKNINQNMIKKKSTKDSTKDEREKIKKLEKDISLPPTEDVDYKIKCSPPELGRKISLARTNLKLNQSQLAQKLCINVKDLKMIEFGTYKVSNDKLLNKICQFLKIKKIITK